ncbi:hypothetical protein GCM10010872_14500 [Dyella flava]|nr:hypothetical protein GCM10010872_14500 [Dyella flava]
MTGQTYVARVAFEQGHTHQIFESANVLADRGLREAYALGRDSEVRRFGHDDETAKKFGGQGSHCKYL